MLRGECVSLGWKTAPKECVYVQIWKTGRGVNGHGCVMSCLAAQSDLPVQPYKRANQGNKSQFMLHPIVTRAFSVLTSKEDI